MRRVVLAGRRLTIGRSSRCDVTLADERVSKRHAELRPGPGGGWLLVDCESTNGTWLNGERVTDTVLGLGDRFRVGGVELRIEAWEESRADSVDRALEVLGARADEIAGESQNLLMRVSLSDVERRFVAGLKKGYQSADLLERLQVLYRLTAKLNADTGLESTCDATLDCLVETVSCDCACLLLSNGSRFEPKAVRFRAGSGRKEGEVPISATMLREAVRCGEAIVTADALEDGRWSESGSICLHSIRSALTVPLAVEGAVVGAVQLYRREAKRPFGEPDVVLATLICNHAAAAIANAKLVYELRNTNRRLEEARGALERANRDLEARVRARTEEVLARSRDLERMSRQKDELLGMVAHDLRTPLTGMLGFVEMIGQALEAEVPHEQLLDDVRTVYEIGTGMAALLNDLLDVARIEAGRLELCSELQPVAPMLEDLERLFSRQAEAREIRLRIELEPGLPALRFDRRRIMQVLNNLLHNAMKFTPAGGSVTVRAEREPQAVRIAVEDTGCGMSAEVLKRVFARFERGAAGKEHAGAGLGLAIARKLVELHGGEIGASAREGDGSCFWFTLPLEDAADPEADRLEDDPGAMTCYDLDRRGL